MPYLFNEYCSSKVMLKLGTDMENLSSQNHNVVGYLWGKKEENRCSYLLIFV